MDVELYTGYIDHTWDTKTATIPDSTPSEKVGEVAVDHGEKEFFNNLNTKGEVAFIGVYNIPPHEEE